MLLEGFRHPATLGDATTTKKKMNHTPPTPAVPGAKHVNGTTYFGNIHSQAPATRSSGYEESLPKGLPWLEIQN